MQITRNRKAVMRVQTFKLFPGLAVEAIMAIIVPVLFRETIYVTIPP